MPKPAIWLGDGGFRHLDAIGMEPDVAFASSATYDSVGDSANVAGRKRIEF
jgi:hypothetical protein